MNDAQLAKLSLKELLVLQNKVAAAIETRRATERAELKNKIAKLAADSGFELNELMGLKRGATKGSKVAPKFANLCLLVFLPHATSPNAG